MKSVLMISPYFVPRRRVGALRTFKFAIHLKEFEYEPVILTIKDSQSLATTAEKELLSRLNVIELSAPIDRTNKVGYISQEKVESENKTGIVASWIDRHTPSDTWIYFYLYHYRKVLRLAKKAKPRLIWATGDPWSSLVMGSFLAKRLAVPFVSDFRDPWTRSGISLRDRSVFSHYWDKKLESRVFRDSSKVVFTSKSAEKEYSEFYSLLPGKTSVIYNSCNDQIESESYKTSSSNIDFNSDDLNLVFFGTFRRLSPITPVADMLAEVRIQSPDLLSKIKVHSFGEPDSVQLSYAEKQGTDECFIFHQKVKPEEGRHILNQSDILLLSTHPERGNIVPAKLWDYLNTDVPILSIAPNSEVGELIGDTGAGIHFHPTDLKNAAEKLSEWVYKKQKYGRESLLRCPLSNAQHENNTSRSKAKQLAGIFDELTAHD